MIGTPKIKLEWLITDLLNLCLVMKKAERRYRPEMVQEETEKFLNLSCVLFGGWYQKA